MIFMLGLYMYSFGNCEIDDGGGGVSSSSNNNNNNK
jgi:hypothetical protein